MPDEVESAMAEAMEKELASDSRKEDRSQVATAPRSNGGSTAQDSLATQFQQLETIQSRLKDRVRQERLSLLHDFETRKTAINIAFERELYKATAQLEHNRDEALKRLADEFHDKAREYDMLVSRMS